MNRLIKPAMAAGYRVEVLSFFEGKHILFSLSELLRSRCAFLELNLFTSYEVFLVIDPRGDTTYIHRPAGVSRTNAVFEYI